MNQWDIVIINFPFTDLSNAKTRPAIIISNSKFNKKSNLILLAISTKSWIQDYSVPIKKEDIEYWCLNKDSFIRLQNILCLEKRLIINRVAKIKDKKLQEIREKIISYF